MLTQHSIAPMSYCSALNGLMSKLSNKNMNDDSVQGSLTEFGAQARKWLRLAEVSGLLT